MPTPTKGKRLGGSAAHERAILANLATSLFEYGSITTTETKARRLRPFAERLITKARRGDLHARRQVMRVIRDKTVVHELFTEIGPRFVNRPGGYTRITKIGPRKGDNAPMAVIALVEEEMPERAATTSQAPAASAPAASAPATEAGQDAAADEPTVAETSAADSTVPAEAEEAGAAQVEVEAEPAAGSEAESAGDETDASDAGSTDEAAAGDEGAEASEDEKS